MILRLQKKTMQCPSKPGRMAMARFFVIWTVTVMIGLAWPIKALTKTDHVHHPDPAHDMDHSDHTVRPEYPDMFKTEERTQPVSDQRQAGIKEKLGQFVSADISFRDENGTHLSLGDFIDRPTLILPVFYHCPRTCSLLLANLAKALNDVTFIPGKEYRVIAFGFDDEETPEDAENAKKNYLPLLKKEFPASEWRFLTGTAENIDALAEDMGFTFTKLAAHSFVHPNVLLCVAKDRKIIRYLYGPDFLPFDISMAVAEAERGTPGISIKKIVSLCFAYDPKGKRYVFKTFRISGIIIITLLAGFLYYLVRKPPKGRGKQ